MTITASAFNPPMPASARDFFALTKPRVMSLVVFTALCGLLVAPVAVNPVIGFAAILAIALGAGASGALNQWYEAGLDAKMRRTAKRPLPDGRMEPESALQFGLVVAGFSILLMGFAANWLSAGILAFSIFFYAVIYTMWLKPRTPQNIVIGGAAGAFPPLIGWAAVTGDVTLMPVLMFAIIFAWTPPHFWALALFMNSDYEKAGIPMLPVVAGQAATRRQIVLYAVIMAAVAVAPWLLGFTGAVYGISVSILSLVFVAMAIRVGINRATEPAAMKPEKQLFAFSILYLFALFAILVLDARLPL